MITEGKIGAYVIELASLIKNHIKVNITEDIQYITKTINENKDNHNLIKFTIAYRVGSGFSQGIWEFTRKHNIKLKQLSVQANINSAGAAYDSGKLLLDKELINKFIDDVMEDMHVDSMINKDNDTVLELLMDSIAFAASLPNFRQIVSTTIHELEHLMQFKNGMDYDKVEKYIPTKNVDKLKEYYTKYCNNSWEISAFSNEYAAKYIQENPDFTEQDITFLIQSALIELKNSYPRADISTTNKKKFLKNVYGIFRKYLDERQKDIITETKIGAYVVSLRDIFMKNLDDALANRTYDIWDRSNTLGYDKYIKVNISIAIESAIKNTVVSFCKEYNIAINKISFLDGHEGTASMNATHNLIIDKKLYALLVESIYNDLVLLCPSKVDKNYVEEEHNPDNIYQTMVDNILSNKMIINNICHILIHELAHSKQFSNGMPKPPTKFPSPAEYLADTSEQDAFANQAAAKFIMAYPKYTKELVSSALRGFLRTYKYTGKDRERFMRKVYMVLMHHLEIKQK